MGTTKKKRNPRSKNNSSFGKKVRYIFFTILIIGFIAGISSLYHELFTSNIKTKNDYDYLYIPTGADYKTVVQLLKQNQFILNEATFDWTSDMFGYKNKVKAGKYRITKDMSNQALVRLLMSGKQEIVHLTFNNIRLEKEFAGFIGKNLECDSADLMNLLQDRDFLAEYGFDSDNVYTMFIPNTYDIFWNINSENFFKRMNKEYKKFWNESRMSKAKALALSPSEISILASIVDQETMRDKEMPVIAGVYLNRLKLGRPLQADPTVVFANGDFSIKRVAGEMLSLESPYNTYKYKGLPPGPISMPTIKAIDAVLNHQAHDYLYFCAKDDFTGYHTFAKTFEEHKENARRFQQALNRKNINP